MALYNFALSKIFPKDVHYCSVTHERMYGRTDTTTTHNDPLLMLVLDVDQFKLNREYLAPEKFENLRNLAATFFPTELARPN